MPRKDKRVGLAPEALDPFRLQHMAPAERLVASPNGPVRVTINTAESPLSLLVRRKDRPGRPLLTTAQFLAGERLREDFTFAQMTPRMTASWDRPAARQRAAADFLPMTERIVAARKRVRKAIEAAGPEFGDLLLDICCFLRGLEEVERERQWPSRSAKLVLQLGLDRLARHYGLEVRCRECAAMRTWSSNLEN